MPRPHVKVISRSGRQFFIDAEVSHADCEEWRVQYEAILNDFELWTRSASEPVRTAISWRYWVYREYVVVVDDSFTDEQARLLIVDKYNKERIEFEKLKLAQGGTS